MSDWGTYVGNGALVIATIGLVLYTRRLVLEARAARVEAERTREEMERGRRLGIKPMLAFDVMILGGKAGLLLIRNVGNGPALDVNLEIIFTGGEEDDRRNWSESSVVPGESHELKLPEPALQDIRALKETPLKIQVTGTMRTLEQERIEVAEDIDLAAWWRAILTARERLGGRRKLPGVDPSSWGLVDR